MSLNCLAAAVGPWEKKVNQPASYRKCIRVGPNIPFYVQLRLGCVPFFFLPTHWIIEFCLSPSNLKTLKEPKGLQKVLMLFVGNFVLDSLVLLSTMVHHHYGYHLRNIFYFFQASNKLWIERQMFIVEDFGLQNDWVPKNRPKIQPLISSDGFIFPHFSIKKDR